MSDRKEKVGAALTALEESLTSIENEIRIGQSGILRLLTKIEEKLDTTIAKLEVTRAEHDHLEGHVLRLRAKVEGHSNGAADAE